MVTQDIGQETNGEGEYIGKMRATFEIPVTQSGVEVADASVVGESRGRQRATGLTPPPPLKVCGFHHFQNLYQAQFQIS